MSRQMSTLAVMNPWAGPQRSTDSSDGPLSGEPGFWHLPPGAQVEGTTLESRAVLGGFVRDGYRLTIDGVTQRWNADKAQVPDEHVLDALRAHRIALLTDENGEKNAPYGTWRNQSPLPLKEIKIIDRSALELQLEVSLARLETVFRAPVAQLISREEVVPVHQSRGLRPRTIPHLASHPRDWRYRTLARVHPSRVLSGVRDETLLTYENRAAAGLVARLLSRLDHRLRALRDVNAAKDVLTGFQDLAGGSFRLARRVCDLWGEAVSSETDWAGAVEIERDLEAWLLRLRVLTQTPLYRAIPPAMRLHTVPSPTNLLTKHPQYQHVYRLWLKLHAQDEKHSDDVVLALAEDRKIVDGMRAFTALVALRALADDGFRPSADSDGFGPGETLELLHRNCDLTVALTWSIETGELLLTVAAAGLATRPLTLVPVALAIDGDKSVALEAQLRRLSPKGGDLGERALVCLDPRRTQRDGDTPSPGRGANHPPLRTAIELADPERPWLIVTVSPFQPLSVERMARLFRAWIWPQVLAARPATLVNSEPWMKLSRVTGLLDKLDLQRLQREIRELITGCTGEVGRLREHAERSLEGSTKRGGSTKQQKAERTQAKHDLVAAEQRLLAANDVGVELSEHLERFTHSERCVVCLHPVVKIEPRPQGFGLRCQSKSCQALSGRLTHADGHLVTFTQFDAAERGDFDGVGREGWQQVAEVERLSVRDDRPGN